MEHFIDNSTILKKTSKFFNFVSLFYLKRLYDIDRDAFSDTFCEMYKILDQFLIPNNS